MAYKSRQSGNADTRLDFWPERWYRDEDGYVVDSDGDAVPFARIQLLIGNTPKREEAEQNTDLACRSPELFVILRQLINELGGYQFGEPEDIAVTEPIRLGRELIAEIEESRR